VTLPRIIGDGNLIFRDILPLCLESWKRSLILSAEIPLLKRFLFPHSLLHSDNPDNLNDHR
jgi:hypothetical protein